MSFTINYVAGGVLDKVRELPYPHFSKFTIPYLKGRKISVGTDEKYTDTFTLPFRVEFLSLAFAASKYCDGDYWELSIGDIKVCESVYTKELPESVSMGNSFGVVYPVESDVPFTFIYYNNSGQPKSVWYNIKFLREGVEDSAL